MRQAPEESFRLPRRCDAPRGVQFAQVFPGEHGKHRIQTRFNFVGTQPSDRTDNGTGVRFSAAS